MLPVCLLLTCDLYSDCAVCASPTYMFDRFHCSFSIVALFVDVKASKYLPLHYE